MLFTIFPEEERRCRAVKGIDQGIAMSATIERRIVSGISTVLALSGLSGGVQKTRSRRNLHAGFLLPSGYQTGIEVVYGG